MKRKILYTFYACLAAVLYAINIPCSKLLLPHAGSVMTASFLYLGAGIGLFVYELIAKVFRKQEKTEKLTKSDMPFVRFGGNDSCHDFNGCGYF